MPSAGDPSISAAIPPYFGDHGAGNLGVRRRRTSVSSKLLGIFTKPPQPPPKRPVISLPQPLEPRRITSTCLGSSSAYASTQAQTHSQAAKRKRGSREDSLDADENDEPVGDEDQSRATSRLRLDSTVSSHKAWPTRRLDASSLANPSRPLKSALKKSASEADADSDCGSGAVARRARTTKDPLSSEGASHNGAKGAGALKTTTQHNRGGSAYSPSSSLTPSSSKYARRTSEVPSVVAGCTPFPSFCSTTSTSRTDATAQDSLPPPTPSKKTVTFADEDAMVNLKRSRTFRDFSDATDGTWDGLANEIDTLGSKPISSNAISTSTTTSARRSPASPRHQSDPTSAISLKSSRAYKPLPLVPQMTPSSALSYDTRHILYETKGANARTHDSDFRAFLALQAPPTPEATLKLKPFTLPASALTHKSCPLGKEPILKNKADAGKENGSTATAMLDEVLRDIAREKAERQNGQTVPKPVFSVPCRDQSDVLRRFKVDVLADERHCTIWDGRETDIYAWSGTLVVHDAKPASYFYPRHSIHDFSIRFHTVAEPSSDPHTFDPTPSRTKYEWEATYRGHRISSPVNKGVPPGLAAPRLDPARGIAVETEYRLLPDDPDGPCRWEVRFWVPVPLRLFGRAEHRTFVCRAKVTVRDWETPKTDVPAGCIAVGIEHLRTGRLLTVPSR
ncbi:hypothetical protein C8Q73DRAFT_669451 [Cubamyces lactineus]|nr:hypothetical protein C8Q73DRAFT_669451 [Cubamyces lactineus]